MKNINRISGISLKLILSFISMIIIFSLMLSTGCSNKGNVKTDGASVSETQSGQSSTGSSQNSGSGDSSTTAQSSSTTTKLETTTSEQIPSDIQKMIDDANTYYNKGEYFDAVSAYRKIRPAVEENDSISASLKEQILDSYSENFEDSKTITETTRMHYGNAMQLEYEKRIDEAIKELEAALKIYPKYQDAIDKLNTIKSLYKLK